jgi:peptidoglycan/LPS O-acetylase OafA/YrhL
MSEVSVTVAERGIKENLGSGQLRSITWLRIIATFLVTIYHAIRFFDLSPSDIALSDPAFQFFLESFSRFLTQWHMPLFFVLSGFSLRLSFSKACRLSMEIRPLTPTLNLFRDAVIVTSCGNVFSA